MLRQALAEEPGIRAQEARQEPTGLPLQTLQWVGQSICTALPEFQLHPEVDALLKSRRCPCFTCSRLCESDRILQERVDINHPVAQPGPCQTTKASYQEALFLPFWLQG